MKIRTFLRIRPLEPKHKLKEDFFTVKQSQDGYREEEQKGGGKQLKSAIVIHDPLKRSKDQFEFKFDHIYFPEHSNNKLYKDSISGIVDKALKSGELGLVISFGHKDGGKSYTVIGNSNHQLQKSITDPIELSDDSRGLLLRCLHQIKQKDPAASITLSAIDVAMDSIRDLLKYVQKEHSKSTQEINSGSMKSTSLQQNRQSVPTSQLLIQSQKLEKEFLELHERQGESGKTQYYLKNVTSIPITDLNEASLFIDKCHEMSEVLNLKLNYTVGIRQNQIFTINVASSAGVRSSIVIIDSADYERLQTNIIDNQKLYESIVLNNTFNTLTSLLGDLNKGRVSLETAPYDNSKLTRILQSIIQQTNPKKVNLAFMCCIWPTESKYGDVLNTLKFVDRIKLKEEVMAKSEYQGEMSTNQERIMQDMSKENVDMKFKIDAFKREHQQRLVDLKDKLGIDVPIETTLKSKGNQRELQVIKEHKEAIGKTEQFHKQNREIETKLETIQKNVEDDEMAKREIQEHFSQKYYILHKQIDQLREEFKQGEMELDVTMRGQLTDRNEELQRILNNTHSMLVENSSLVDQLNDSVVQRTNAGSLESKRINFMKDEGKREAEASFNRLMEQQEKEWSSHLNSTRETHENLLKKKEDDLRKATEDFKNFHEKIKIDEQSARSELVKLYHMAKKQNDVLNNIENGVYSQYCKKISFDEMQKPSLPQEARFKYLFKALERHSQKGTMGQTSFSQMNGFQGQTTGTKQDQELCKFSTAKQGQNQARVSSTGYSNGGTVNPDTVNLNKKVEGEVNPDSLRVYVKQLMGELNKHASTHPQVLKGENVNGILQEIEKNKKLYEEASKKNNDLRIHIEAQRRLIERASLAKSTQGIRHQI